MAKTPFFLLFFIILLQTHLSFELQESQIEAFLTIQQILNNPPTLNALDPKKPDFCNIEPTPYLTIVCFEENITQIHTRWLDGVSPISGSFSMDALFRAFSGLPNLKVLSLVSQGLWGPIPSIVGNLTSLEILNLSSNYLNGTIPNELLGLQNLQTIILDHNGFYGNLPPWIGSLSELTVLSLKNNSLSGSLPGSLSRLDNLRILQLSMNRFSGEVPELSNLTNLQVLDLGNNSLGPKFPVLHNKLVSLVLRKNKFGFGLSDDLTSFYQLQKLDVSSNAFSGHFPVSLFGMPLIGYLNIARNKFHGKLLENVTCGAHLSFVDLSFNYLTGDLPRCLLKRRNESRIVRCRGNCLANASQWQNPHGFCHNEALAVKILPHRGRSSSKIVVAMSIVGGTSLAGLMVLGIGFVFSKRAFKKPQTRVILEKATTAYPPRLFDAREICQTMKLGPLGLPVYRNFLLDEIKEATENFSNANLIGGGSYGPVYKGRFADDSLVAIRCLKMRKRRGVQAYTHHIELLSKLRHTHLVSALGHCFEYNPEDSTVSRIFLIFEYIPSGTLRDFISRNRPSWSQRLTAAIEIAKGVQFLQTGTLPGLYSNNIKITDVLLDNSLRVKLNNYNLPLLAENKETADADLPSKESGKVKEEEKSDVRDFGVILLEIITGGAITVENDISILKDLFQVSINADKIARKQILDPAAYRECSDNSLKIVMDLCLRSLSSEPNERPSIEDALWNLQFAAQVQDSWQGDTPSNTASPVFTSQ